MKGSIIPADYDSEINKITQEYGLIKDNPRNIMSPIVREIHKVASIFHKPVDEVIKDVEKKYEIMFGGAISGRKLLDLILGHEPSKKDRNMSRNRKLVVFLDGTDNRPEELEDAKKKKYGLLNPPPITNVVRMLRGVSTDAGTLNPQVIGYFRGVGNEGNVATKFVDCVTGDGLSRIVLDAYRFISHNLEWNKRGQVETFPEIYLFGFSRGAFAARALSGFMNKVGLVKKEHLASLPFIFIEYQKLLSEGKQFDPQVQRMIDALTYKERPIPVRFLGVWDTVGALGLPIKLLSLKTVDYQKIYDTELSPNVTHAFQALAIHELRSPFKPVFWTKKGKSTQIVEQVWFCGAHSNVGGGYKAIGLSSYALEWMAYKAQKVGLELNMNYFKTELSLRNIREKIEPSRNLNGVWGFIKYPKLIRPVDPDEIDSYLDENFPQSKSKMQKDILIGIKAHYSVEDRLSLKLPHNDEIESFNKLDNASRKLLFTSRNEKLI